jgi:hypothetical protein
MAKEFILGGIVVIAALVYSLVPGNIIDRNLTEKLEGPVYNFSAFAGGVFLWVVLGLKILLIVFFARAVLKAGSLGDTGP